MNWAFRKAQIIQNCPYVELPPKPESQVSPLSDRDMHALIDGADAPHIRLAIILLLATGARVSALLDLTWDRVDFDLGGIDLRLPDGATRKGRAVIPMNAMARASLQTAYPARLTYHVIEWAGKRVKSIRKGYYNALQRAMLQDVDIHQIRHTAAVRMLSSGMSMEKVSQYLGHSNIQITRKVYAKFTTHDLADAADVLNLDGFIELKRTS